MSLRITGNANLWSPGGQYASGHAAASMSALLRYDGPPAAAYLEIVQHYFEIFALFANRNRGSQLLLDFFWNTEMSTGEVAINTGTVFHVAMTYAHGRQRYWVNAIPTTMGPVLSGDVSAGTLGMTIGDAGAAASADFHLEHLFYVAGYEFQASEIQALRDGTTDPHTLGASLISGGQALDCWHWTLAGTDGATAAAGDPGLADTFGHPTPFNDLRPGSGTITYGAPLVVVPTATIIPKVGPSGNTLYVECRDLSGVLVEVQQYVSEPAISINGGAPITLDPAGWKTIRGQYDFATLFRLPKDLTFPRGGGTGSLPLLATDAVTITAPQGAYNTTAGITAALSGAVVENRVGRTLSGVEGLVKTFKMGVIAEDLCYSTGCANVMEANVLRRAGDSDVHGFGGNWRIDGPTTITTNPAWAIVLQSAWSDNGSGLDETGQPMAPAGLYARRWDNTDLAHPVELGIACPAGAGVATHLSQYDNPGNPDGTGQVRVYQVDPTPGNANIIIRATYSGGLDTSGTGVGPWTLGFASDALLMPGDFTPVDHVANPGSYTTIPPVPPGASHAIMRTRFPDGLGAIRWFNGVLTYDQTASTVEPEHMVPSSAYSYSNAALSQQHVDIANLLPFDPSARPYFYSHQIGDTYSCTLASGTGPSYGLSGSSPAGQLDQVYFADADAPDDVVGGTGPVMVHQPLWNGAEELRVMAVDLTGPVPLVTVERGACGTTPQAAAAGATLTVGYRKRMGTTLSTWFPGAGVGYQYLEVETVGRHGLAAGQQPIQFGTWPVVTLTDGSGWGQNPPLPQFLGGSSQYFAYVTGPTKFVITIGNPDGNVPNVTISAPAAASGAYVRIIYPTEGSAWVPYDAQARVNNQYGADHWINIPHAASRALVHKAATLIRDTAAPGSKLWIEISNENWNLGYPPTQFYWFLDTAVLHSGVAIPGLFMSVVDQSGVVRKIFRDVMGAVGRADDVRVLCGCQRSDYGSVTAALNRAKANNAPIDGFCYAPYFNLNRPTGVNSTIYYTDDIATVCDAAMHRILSTWTPKAQLDLNDVNPYADSYSFWGDAIGDGATYGFRPMIDNWTAANAAWVAANCAGGKLHLGCYEDGWSTAYWWSYQWDSIQDVGGLNGTDVTTTFHVASAARFSNIVGGYLLLDPYTQAENFSRRFCFHPTRSEWVLLQSVDTGANTITVLRGQSGTTAKAHAQGVMVRDDGIERDRDFMYHPLMRLVDLEQMGVYQRAGQDVVCRKSYATYWGQTNYCTYLHEGQLPGKGDGSDGRADNLACLARPGPGQKSATVNQDMHNVSTRGQAILEWNAAVGTAPAPATSPTVARSPSRARRSRASISR